MNKKPSLCIIICSWVMVVLVGCQPLLPTTVPPTSAPLSSQTPTATNVIPSKTGLPTSIPETFLVEPTGAENAGDTILPSGLKVDGVAQIMSTFWSQENYGNLLSPDMKWIANPITSKEPYLTLTSISDPNIHILSKPDTYAGLHKFGSWAPDSSAIVVTANTGTTKGDAYAFNKLIIYRFVDGTNELASFILDLPGEIGYPEGQITWSPDSRYVAIKDYAKIFIADKDANLKKMLVPVPKSDQDSLYDYYLNDTAFWENGDLFYVQIQYDQAILQGSELRLTNINHPDNYQTITKGDFRLAILGANEKYILVARWKSNREFDLLLINRATLQIEQKGNSFLNSSKNEWPILDINPIMAAPEAPYVTFSVKYQDEKANYHEEVWIFNWDSLLPEKIEFSEPWIGTIGWRPVINSMGFFTFNDNQCTFWILKP